jgi:hypothetical protein
MKSSQADWNVCRAQRAGYIHGPRVLIRLNADHSNQGALAFELPHQSVHADPRVCLIHGRDDDLDIIAQHAPLPAIQRQAVEDGQRIRGNRRTEPLNDVAIVVVMGRFDEDYLESVRR